MICKSEVSSPLGALVVVACRDRVCALGFDDRERDIRAHVLRRYGSVVVREGRPPAPVHDALQAYFDGDLDHVGRLPVDPGGTTFQGAVWDVLRSTEPGSTLTYSDLADRVGQPQARRAVARANAANPIAIVIPCHRAVAVGGRITGYSGGIDRKRWLIEHEGAYARG